MTDSRDVFRVDGCRALVTGGSRGIGFACAKALSEAGADVLLAARNEAHLEEAAASLQASGRRIQYASVDLLYPDRLEAWYDEIVSAHGIPDILVNAAGINRRGRADQLCLEDWEQTLTVNLTAPFALARAFGQRLLAERIPGRIINIGSLMTAATRPTTVAYTASKGGLGQLTKALAADWAPFGILVNAVAPGYVRTQLTEPLHSDPEFDAWVRQRCPLGRWADPMEIARPVLFLASPASGFITGQVLYVDGGWLATF